MGDVEKIIEKEELVTESFVISGRILNLFKEYVMNSVLSKQKYEVMKIINESKSKVSIITICDKLDMSKPLLAYHMNGNLKSKGLIKMEMVDSFEIRGQVYYSISKYGKYCLELIKVVPNPRYVRK